MILHSILKRRQTRKQVQSILARFQLRVFTRCRRALRDDLFVDHDYGDDTR